MCEACVQRNKERARLKAEGKYQPGAIEAYNGRQSPRRYRLGYEEKEDGTILLRISLGAFGDPESKTLGLCWHPGDEELHKGTRKNEAIRALVGEAKRKGCEKELSEMACTLWNILEGITASP